MKTVYRVEVVVYKVVEYVEDGMDCSDTQDVTYEEDVRDFTEEADAHIFADKLYQIGRREE
jgi:hypothetical protein